METISQLQQKLLHRNDQSIKTKVTAWKRSVNYNKSYCTETISQLKQKLLHGNDQSNRTKVTAWK
jgi:hypothetical protein